jgi:glycosyltransferase involved in cell wall biosynthesis
MNKKIVYIINHAAFFVSHRLVLALKAMDEGWDVHLIIGQAGSEMMEKDAEVILSQVGIPFTRVAFRAAGVNPFVEFVGFAALIWHVRKLRPMIVHVASPKAVLYGSLVARILRVKSLVVAISGMGFLFTGQPVGLKRFLSCGYKAALRWAFQRQNLSVIVQNKDDKAAITDGFVKSGSCNIALIPGSGVALEQYDGHMTSKAQNIVILPARMLRDKGVVEFVEAARVIRQSGSCWRFVLVGAADYQSPAAIPRHQIDSWVKSGVVEWWGHRTDMPNVFAQADIVCLPSYREGMPKCLLEAAAAGCPVVTTDVPGCREALIEGETGELVPARDIPALVNVLKKMISDPERRVAYGKAGREMAINRFGIDAVVQQTMDIYNRDLHEVKG